MRILGLWLLLIVLWIGAAIPAQAALVTVNGTGVIPGTTTHYTCTQFPEYPPYCPSQQSPDSFFLNVVVTVDTDALTGSPARFGEQVGFFYFAQFSIVLNGIDQWGNYLFEGRDLTIEGTSNLHPCFGGHPCTWDHSSFAASTFSVIQTLPAPVPEPATWVIMLLGFAAIGLKMRRSVDRRVTARTSVKCPLSTHSGH
jgi:hypothetical protein